MKEEEMMEEIKAILEDTEIGLNRDSIAAIMLFNLEIDIMQSTIDTIKSGKIWAEYQGDQDLEDMDLDLFVFYESNTCPINQEIFKIDRSKHKYKNKQNNKFDSLLDKIPHLLCIQNFLEAGMTDEDAIDLFNRYFPEANIDLADCDFIRQRSGQHIDPETEKALEKKSREIVDIMRKGWK